MEPHVSITTGHGGHGSHGGTGGRAGDVHLHYDGTSLLMALPRAQYAAYNSAREDAPSSCLEGTRVAILEEILTWSESANGERPPVYWLNGLAGIGKSTIAKTVAERARENAILGATFFFSRNDKPLRNPRLVLPTLAFQLAQSDTAFKEAIVEALSQDPTAGEKELFSQLQQLILTPLLTIDPDRTPILIILDALDECEEKGAADILRLVFSHLIRIPFLRILVTSRPQPHLSSVFNKVPNLAKTVLHDIDESIVQRDIRLYISAELAKIPGKIDGEMTGNWATEADINSLVEKCGKLFVYAATAIRFIADDRVRDPRTHLKLILNTQYLQEAGATPYSHLDELYMEVLRNSLSSFNRREILKRFQIVVGSIVVLREPLSLQSLAKFIQYKQHVVEDSLSHLHSVIVPPSDIDEAPRIYHPSFLEFITDPSRCSMEEFVIVAHPEQELRHAVRCFELMAASLKRDIARISDPSLLNSEVDGFEEKVNRALPPEIQYACRYWASHLSRVKVGETGVMEALEAFTMRSILWWFEALSLLGSVSYAGNSIAEAHRWAKNSKCKAIVVSILSDCRRFLLAHGEVIRASALHVYHSALPFTPHGTELYKAYCEDGKDSIKVVLGLESEWPQNLATLHGHSNSVAAVAFSPDGLCLASGSWDCTVQLWDAVSGASIAKLEGHSGQVWAVAFSPDGLHLASGSDDHTLQVWDAISTASIAQLEGHSGPVSCIAFSPNGFHLASGSDDHTVRVWDAISGVSIAMLEGHSHLVTAVAFSPDGLCLASGSSDGTLQLWGAVSGTYIPKPKANSGLARNVAFLPDQLKAAISYSSDTLGTYVGLIEAIAFLPDGLYLASGSMDGTIGLWDATSGALIGGLKDLPGWPGTIAFSPNGLSLAFHSDENTVQVWDHISGTSIAKLEGHPSYILSVALSPDGLQLASGSIDQTVRLWDPISGTSISQLEGHSNQVTAVAFSPNGLYLASGFQDGTLQLWDAMLCMIMATLKGHSNLVTAIACSSDGLHLASGFDNGTLQLWDATSSISIAMLKGHSDWVETIVFSPDGLHLASGSGDHTVDLWDATSGASIPISEGHSHLVHGFAFSSDGHALVSYSGLETFTWDLTSHPPHQLASGSSLQTPWLSVGQHSLFWDVQGSWVHVKWEDVHNHTRKICCIPPHHLPCTWTLRPQTHYQIAVGCEDGHMFILDLPHDLFNGCFIEEPVSPGLWSTVATLHSSLTSHDIHFLNEETPLINHHTLHNRHAWGFSEFLQWLKVMFCC